MEAITHQEILSPGTNQDFAFLDNIGSEPVATRQAVKVVIFSDGSANYLMEKQIPERLILPSAFEGVPPSEDPPITKTKVTGSMAYFYDDQDNLLYQHPVEEDYALLEDVARLTGSYDYEAEALAEDAEVEWLNETTMRIRKPVPDESGGEGLALRTAGQRYTEEIVVPKLGIVLGSSIHESNGELVCRIKNRYSYSEDKDQWQPKSVYYEEYGTDEVTGSQYVSQTTYYYDNYSLQTN